MTLTIKKLLLVTCSSGTYVRSLANDLALSLNSFCYCTKITRLRDGIFSKKNSYPLKNLINVENSEDFRNTYLILGRFYIIYPQLKLMIKN